MHAKGKHEGSSDVTSLQDDAFIAGSPHQVAWVERIISQQHMSQWPHQCLLPSSDILLPPHTLFSLMKIQFPNEHTASRQTDQREYLQTQ